MATRPRHLRKRFHEFRSYRAVVIVKPGQSANVSCQWESRDHFTWDELKAFAAWLYTVINFYEMPSKTP